MTYIRMQIIIINSILSSSLAELIFVEIIM